MDLGQLSTSKEQFLLPDGITAQIEKYYFEFDKWNQPVTFDTYNGKPIVSYEGQPLFAELMILKILESKGYAGVWVDTYRNKFWQGLPTLTTSVTLNEFLLSVYNSIRYANEGQRKGCWDILAYKDKEVVFVELKRRNKDAIRQSQIEWLHAAFKAGYKIQDFIIAEWDFASTIIFT